MVPVLFQEGEADFFKVSATAHLSFPQDKPRFCGIAPDILRYHGLDLQFTRQKS